MNRLREAGRSGMGKMGVVLVLLCIGSVWCVKGIAPSVSDSALFNMPAHDEQLLKSALEKFPEKPKPWGTLVLTGRVCDRIDAEKCGAVKGANISITYDCDHVLAIARQVIPDEKVLFDPSAKSMVNKNCEDYGFNGKNNFLAETTTDEQGAFKIEGLPFLSKFSIHAQAYGFQPAVVKSAMKDGLKTTVVADIELKPLATARKKDKSTAATSANSEPAQEPSLEYPYNPFHLGWGDYLMLCIFGLMTISIYLGVGALKRKFKP